MRQSRCLSKGKSGFGRGTIPRLLLKKGGETPICFPAKYTKMSEFSTPRSKHRREEVLSEEDYLQVVDDLIERDYFPEVRRLKALTAVITAEQTGNIALVDQAREQYVRVVEGDKQGKRQGLDEFLRTFTSEDNLSYAKIQEQERTRLKEKYWWIHKAAETEKKRQALAAPQGLPALTAPEALSLNDFQPFTSFMFAPQSEDMPRTLATLEDFSGPAKETLQANTRLKEEFVGINEQPGQPSTHSGKIYEEVKTPQVPVPITWGELDSTPQTLEHGRRFTVRAV